MKLPSHETPCLPPAPRSIQKGVPLKQVINDQTVAFLARNISLADQSFDPERFVAATKLTDAMSLMERGRHLGDALFEALDRPFSACAEVLLASLTPLHDSTEEFGLAGMFYLPHSALIGSYGVDPIFNDGADPFDDAMRLQHAMTQRFTAEFCIREFLIAHPERTLEQLMLWTGDPSAHVRRLCSEGSRPRLPWGKRLKAIDTDPTPILPLLDILKDDPERYVVRSVANSLGDIGKQHLSLVLEVCERWLEGASAERRWLIRHALRHPAKKGDAAAISLRQRAK